MTQKQIDHYVYQTSNALGEGSTGTVYLGKDTRTGKQVAVKAINMRNVDNEVTRYLLQNQIKALQLNNHPNVLRALDVIRKSDFCYVITDYLPGKTLHQMIRSRGMIPENEALSIFKAIAEGYAEIQRHRIVHRDLKPQNIMFSAEGNPVICDFGYSEITGYLPKPKMYYNVGSPAYMAPESIVGSLYNENSEVWSLGTILYEMLEGKAYVPSDKQVMQTIMKIKRNGLVYPTGASEFSKSILRDTMKLKPEERISVKNLVSKLASVPSLKNGQTHLQNIQPSHQFQQTPPVQQIMQIQPMQQPQELVQGVRPVLSNHAPFVKSSFQDKHNMSYNFEDHNALIHPDTPTRRPISSGPGIVDNPFNRNSMPVEINMRKDKMIGVDPIQATLNFIPHTTLPNNIPQVTVQPSLNHLSSPSPPVSLQGSFSNSLPNVAQNNVVIKTVPTITQQPVTTIIPTVVQNSPVPNLQSSFVQINNQVIGSVPHLPSNRVVPSVNNIQPQRVIQQQPIPQVFTPSNPKVPVMVPVVKKTQLLPNSISQTLGAQIVNNPVFNHNSSPSPSQQAIITNKLVVPNKVITNQPNLSPRTIVNQINSVNVLPSTNTIQVTSISPPIVPLRQLR